MAITAYEFIKVAQENLERDTGERGIRTAISRAYYGMYHACLNLSGPVPRKHPSGGVFKGGTHSRLSQYMTECAENISEEKVIEIRKLGVKLKMYHKYRCDADYEIDKEIDKTFADVVICEAINTINFINEVKPSAA